MSLVPQKSAMVPHPNSITEYTTPTFDNKITWLGWGVIGAMAAGGAYQGYTSNLSLPWTGWERRSEINPAGNIALGAVAGLASGLLITSIVGGNAPIVTSDNAATWLEKLDDRMILIPTDASHPGLPLTSIRAIARNADASFMPGSLGEVRFFLATFPSSPHRDRILGTFIRTVHRELLIQVAEIAQGLPAEQQAMERYIAETPTFEEAIAMAGRFSAYRPTLEQRAATFVWDLNDLQRYRLTFPGSIHTDTIAVRVSDRLKRDEIPEFLAMFPMIRNLPDLKLRYITSSPTTIEAIRAMRRYPELEAVAERQAAQLAESPEDYRAYLIAFPDGPAAKELRARMHAELYGDE